MSTTTSRRRVAKATSADDHKVSADDQSDSAEMDLPSDETETEAPADNETPVYSAFSDVRPREQHSAEKKSQAVGMVHEIMRDETRRKGRSLNKVEMEVGEKIGVKTGVLHMWVKKAGSAPSSARRLQIPRREVRSLDRTAEIAPASHDRPAPSSELQMLRIQNDYLKSVLSLHGIDPF